MGKIFYVLIIILSLSSSVYADSLEEREALIKDNIVQIAETEFPDNIGLQWSVFKF